MKTLVNTSRFGILNVRSDREIYFPDGLLGFASFNYWFMLEAAADSPFFWLQSSQDPELAFVLTDPCLFKPEYRFGITSEQMKGIWLHRIEDAICFVIVNRVDGQTTGNLAGPLVVNPHERLGVQVVLPGDDWTTREVLMPRQGANPASSQG